MANLNNIPAELRELKQWVFWKADKKPHNPHNNTQAKTNDLRTWGTFKQAIQAVKDYAGKGVGFVTVEDDGYVLIDLDKIIDDDGHIDSEAQIIIDKLDSYTEVSQSGHGIHIIVRANKPSSRCRKDWVEIYETGRYFAMTGELWEGRATIEDRQDELNWLCQETFGETETTETKPSAVDVVLDRKARPPENKLKALLKDEEFKAAWEYNDESLGTDMSAYDWKLACLAIEDGWSDQEIADLIIGFRWERGDDADFQKALRDDYIPRTIAKARQGTGTAGILNLEDGGHIEVKKVVQIGQEDCTYTIVLTDDREIFMGMTAKLFLSSTNAEERFLDAGIILSDSTIKKWRKKAKKLIVSSVERREGQTKEEKAHMWLDDYIRHRTVIPQIERDGGFEKIFWSNLNNSIAIDEQKRIYVRLPDMVRWVAVHTHRGNVNDKTVIADLYAMKFEPTKRGYKKRIKLWVSPPGFIRDTLEDGDVTP